MGEVDLGQLRSLSCLKELHVKDTYCCNFEIPSSWQQLQALDLRDTDIELLPSNLSALISLTSLSVAGRAQFANSMDFVTQLKKLRKMDVSGTAAVGREYDSASLCAIMQAQLLIERTPDCQVELLI